MHIFVWAVVSCVYVYQVDLCTLLKNVFLVILY